MLERERLFTHFVCFRPMLGTVGRGSMSRISRTSIVSWKIPNTIKYLTHIANIQRCIKVYIRWLLETYSGKSSIRLVTCASQKQRSTVLLSIYSHPTLSDNIFRTYAKLLFVWQTQTSKNTHTHTKKKTKRKSNKDTFESFNRHYYIILATFSEVRLLIDLGIVYIILQSRSKNSFTGIFSPKKKDCPKEYIKTTI